MKSRLSGAHILVVDDEAEHGRSLSLLFQKEGANVHTTPSAKTALDEIRLKPIHIVLTDLMMPGMNGQELLKAIRAIAPDTQVIVMTAYGTIEAAVDAMREGAYDFIQKPIKAALAIQVMERAFEHYTLKTENLRLKTALIEIEQSVAKGRSIIGQSPGMEATLERLKQAAPSTANVLIMGESGTGKELFARFLHTHSLRAEKTFVVVNCAALPESILEAELFGYERGAFTGANQQKLGRIERAHQGTLFLDEVGEMSLTVQAKLLRVLQEGELDRLGGSESIAVDFRLVAATHQDLAQKVKDGTFREDLYYRLNVIEVHPPPLRERPEDIPLLAQHFLQRFSEANQKTVLGIENLTLQKLQGYKWPGNVRELENMIERAVVLTKKEMLILEDFPEPIQRVSLDNPSAGLRELHGTQIERRGHAVLIPLGTPLDEIERVLIDETLRETRGDKSLAAQLLGIAPRTIYRKLEKKPDDK